MKFRALFVLAFCFIVMNVFSQVTDPISSLGKFKNSNTELEIENTESSSKLAIPQNEWNKLIPYLCLGLLVFFIIYYAILTIIVVRGIVKVDFLKVFIIPLVIMASVFLVIIGYNEQQISPIIGLLGTIVGFILGKKSEKPVNK